MHIPNHFSNAFNTPPYPPSFQNILINNIYNYYILLAFIILPPQKSTLLTQQLTPSGILLPGEHGDFRLARRNCWGE